ncbi:hypothetical protein, partial [Klebsiella pneumoniae]|uniref:hypothetical protein n=1 Tax=Klebsiella pneumoniae TaxID=573 RepID=UPI0019546672
AQLTAGTYSQLLNSNLKVVDVVNALLVSTLNSQGGATNASRALSSISQSLNASTGRMVLTSLIDVG